MPAKLQDSDEHNERTKTKRVKWESVAKPFFNQATLLRFCTISLPVMVSIVHRPREIGSVSKPGLNRVDKHCSIS